MGMMARCTKLGLFAALLGIGLGCSHARVVERRPDGGGVIAIPDCTNSWPSRHRKRAEDLMARQCPGGYVIEHEQEVIVGQVTKTNTTTDRKGDPLLAAIRIAPVTENTQQTTTQSDVREWRIWFRPKGTPPSAAIPASGAVVPVSAQAQDK